MRDFLSATAEHFKATETVRRAIEAASPSSELLRYQYELATVERLSLKQLLGGPLDQREALLAAHRYDTSAAVGALHHVGGYHQQLLRQSVIDQAYEAARLAHVYSLPDATIHFRTPIESFAERLLFLHEYDWAFKPEYLATLGHSSAVADLFAESTRVDQGLLASTQAFNSEAIPIFENLSDYRALLDAAGLRLPRQPRLRRLTTSERKRQLKARLRGNTEPPQVKRAKSLVYRYEVTLREVLNEVMTETYGPDWAHARLELCDCKDLLRKWLAKGGELLQHADYAHYARIMSHPDHFAAIFEVGFDNPRSLATIIETAGRLRAASHHHHKFTPEDLRDLRVTWLTIEKGLVALTPEYTLES